ncbi:MAG TPA: alpha/beta hydrolase [Dehalococcoidia bacterium]|nr:alpha/beta hydrolase [Dehalococcoidia bacterium]
MRKRTLATLGAIAGAAAGAYALASRSSLHADLDWESTEKPGRLIEIDGYTVHYVEQGSGPAMLLVHGFGGSTYSYGRLMPLLARDHRVIAVDLKGYGYSQRDERAGLSHSDQVAMLRGLLRALGVERAVLVGHSMGGAIVQRFAATYPEMLEALVLAASVAGDERYRRMTPPAALVKPLAPIIAGLAAKRVLELSFYDPDRLTDDLREQYLRPLRIRGTLEGILRSIGESARDPEIDRSRITMPVLLLYAAHDRAVPLHTAQRLRALLPHARLVVIDRAAHLLLEERPEECARAIADFLREERVEARPPAALRDA